MKKVGFVFSMVYLVITQAVLWAFLVVGMRYLGDWVSVIWFVVMLSGVIGVGCLMEACDEVGINEKKGG